MRKLHYLFILFVEASVILFQISSVKSDSCVHSKFLNYLKKDGVPKYCVMNRPRDQAIHGKCVLMTDLWNVFRNSTTSRIFKLNMDHQWLSHEEYNIRGNYRNAWIAGELNGAASLEGYMSRLAPDLSYDEAENTDSTPKVPRDDTRFLQPYSLCKILMDNNIYQFFPEIQTHTCPTVAPECAPGNVHMGNGIKYGVKFVDGSEQKCQLRSVDARKCVPLNKVVDMINNYDGVNNNAYKQIYSQYRMKIYNKTISGFLELRASVGSAEALKKIDAAHGLVELRSDISFGNEKIEIGSITLCHILDMHIPFSNAKLLEFAEDC